MPRWRRVLDWRRRRRTLRPSRRRRPHADEQFKRVGGLKHGEVASGHRLRAGRLGGDEQRRPQRRIDRISDEQVGAQPFRRDRRIAVRGHADRRAVDDADSAVERLGDGAAQRQRRAAADPRRQRRGLVRVDVEEANLGDGELSQRESNRFADAAGAEHRDRPSPRILDQRRDGASKTARVGVVADEAAVADAIRTLLRC